MEDNDLLKKSVIGKGLYKMFLACDLSRCQSHHVWSAPAGTLTRIDGGVVHKGSKCKGKRIRCILFFSCSPDQNHLYDPDNQNTNVSLTIELIRQIYKSKDGKLHIALLELLLILLLNCEESYKKRIHNYFANEPMVESLLKELATIRLKYDKKDLTELLEKYGETELFSWGE